jgi:hypothetical protein
MSAAPHFPADAKNWRRVTVSDASRPIPRPHIQVELKATNTSLIHALSLRASRKHTIPQSLLSLSPIAPDIRTSPLSLSRQHHCPALPPCFFLLFLSIYVLLLPHYTHISCSCPPTRNYLPLRCRLQSRFQLFLLTVPFLKTPSCTVNASQLSARSFSSSASYLVLFWSILEVDTRMVG